MTKEELKKEAEEWLNKWELCNKCENKVNCISNFSYCKKVVLQSYLASAEPREKRIAELEVEVNRLKLNEQLAINNGKNLEKSKERSYSLVKADHIIKKLLWDLRNKNYDPIKDIEEAEKFLGRDNV